MGDDNAVKCWSTLAGNFKKNNYCLKSTFVLDETQEMIDYFVISKCIVRCLPREMSKPSERDTNQTSWVNNTGRVHFLLKKK